MISQYLKIVDQIELLSTEEETVLWSQYKEEGDREARACLIRSYQPLVIKMITSLNVPLDSTMDLLQEGTVGLIEAVENYNPQLGVRFSIYARHRIRGRMLNWLAQYSAEQRAEILAGDEYLLGLERSAAVYPEQPQGYLEEQELQGQVQAALARLPEKERRAVQATYVEGQTSLNSAKELQVSPSYFYKLQKKGLRRMRGMMAQFIAESRRD